MSGDPAVMTTIGQVDVALRWWRAARGRPGTSSRVVDEAIDRLLDRRMQLITDLECSRFEREVEGITGV